MLVHAPWGMWRPDLSMAPGRLSVNAHPVFRLMSATQEALSVPPTPFGLTSPPSPVFGKLDLHFLPLPGHGGGLVIQIKLIIVSHSYKVKEPEVCTQPKQNQSKPFLETV